ncbi:MAG: hypothetical protein WBM52_06435 [Thiogranum sp.]|jgi:hypothetical protein
MTKLFSLLVFLAIIVAVFLYLTPAGDYSSQTIKGLPWQIELLPDGTSKVFGVTLGQSTLGEAHEQLGDDMELAIIVVAADDSGLEMYYSRYTAGVFSGKLILAADVVPDTLEQLLGRAAKAEYMESGARKFHLNPDDLPVAYQAAVKSITFIPGIALDEQTAFKHFGTPAETIRRGDQAVHLLYPGKGLDLTINEDGKDVLQYVAPRDFTELRNPLL